jgi:hypothetical protein
MRPHAARAVLLGGLAAALLAGCQQGTRQAMEPIQPAPAGTPAVQPASRAELHARPLYTFTEAEVEAYLPIARELAPDLPDRVVHLGRKNIGQPYEIYLLGEFPYDVHDPDPLYNLQRSDCLVFCEHVYAMTFARDWWDFLQILQRIRYRDGEIGMATRNHYTLADWNRNNGFLFEDVTPELGDGAAAVPLHQVLRRARFLKRFGLGDGVPDEVIADVYIPKERVPDVVDELRPGDFVNIIRGDEKAQWCGHTGLIALGDDGTVNFLHSHRPTVGEEPLVDYVNTNRGCVGIKILRLHADAEARLRATLADSPRMTPVTPESFAAALAEWPLNVPPAAARFHDWRHASRLQAYRIPPGAEIDAPLQRRIDQLDATVCRNLGIEPEQRAFGVLDLDELRLAMIRPDAMFYGASVPKIVIVFAYLKENPELLDDMPPETLRELQLVIKRSSNELAAKYSQLVGLDRLQEIITSREYRFYDEDHGGGLWCGKHYGLARPRIGDPLHDHSHGATVRQCLRYYLMMEQGRLENVRTCALLKEIFAAPELEFHDESFVRALLPRGAEILRKGGRWEDWLLDTARIEHGGRVYLLAGMTHHPRGVEYLERMAAGIDDYLVGAEE